MFMHLIHHWNSRRKDRAGGGDANLVSEVEKMVEIFSPVGVWDGRQRLLAGRRKPSRNAPKNCQVSVMGL